MRSEQKAERWFFSCPVCGSFKIRDYVVEPNGRSLNADGSAVNFVAERRCACGRNAKVERLEGTLSTVSVCDASCVAARGKYCDCSCGGVNHGIGWLGMGWMIVFRAAGKREQIVESTPERAAEVVAEKRARREAREAAKLQKLAEAKDAKRAAWTADHAEIVGWLGEHEGDDSFLGSLAGSLRQYGSLTERQVAAIEGSRQRSERWAAQRAEEQAKLVGAPPAPQGTATVTGTIASVKDRDGYMGGVEWKMTVKLDDGNRVWLTVPRELEQGFWLVRDNLAEWLTGRRVTVTANFTRSDKDEHFAFGKRPRKASLLEEATA